MRCRPTPRRGGNHLGVTRRRSAAWSSWPEGFLPSVSALECIEVILRKGDVLAEILHGPGLEREPRLGMPNDL